MLSEVLAVRRAEPSAGGFIFAGAFGTATRVAGVTNGALSDGAAEPAVVGAAREAPLPRIRGLLLFDAAAMRPGMGFRGQLRA